MILLVVCTMLAFLAGLYMARPLSGANRGLALLCLGGVIAGVAGVYAINGQPTLSGEPYQARMERLRELDPATLSPDEQEEWLRDAIRRDPENVEALTRLALYLGRTGREREAIRFFGLALRQDENPQTFIDYAEVIISLNEGLVTDQALFLLDEAAQRDPNLAEPSYYSGLAAFQAGDRALATQQWIETVVMLPQGDQARSIAASRAAEMLSRPAFGPAQAGAQGAPTDEAEMAARVEAMVAGVAARLSENPDDLSDWLTLVRARVVLEQVDQAQADYAAARAVFDSQDGARDILIEMGLVLGLEESAS